MGPYRFTGKPFGHLQIHWQALLVVFWDHYRFTGKLQGVQNQPTKGNFFWFFFSKFLIPRKTILAPRVPSLRFTALAS